MRIFALVFLRIVSSIIVTTDQSSTCKGVYGPVMTSNKNGNIKVDLANTAQIIIYNIIDAGKLPKDQLGEWVVCNDEKIKEKQCSQENRGTVVLSNINSDYPIGNYIRNITHAEPILYSVQETGMYCVDYISPEIRSLVINIEFNNSYGNLPGSLYATIPFFTTMTVIYALLCLAWFYGSYKNSKELLPIQKFISYTLGFLVVEYFMNLQLFQEYNRTGELSKSLLYISTILSAGRNSISWFMLLIVSLGYGIWRPSLGKAMYFCIALALTNFVAGCAYSIFGLGGADVDEYALLITLPLSLTISLFYSFSLNALQITIKTLSNAKQNVKLEMYRSITKILGFSIFMAMGVIVLNAVYLARRNEPSILPYLWKWRWMMLDGLFHIVYFVVFSGIALLFMPTSNNQRYGMSEMLQEDVDDVEQFGLEVVHGLDDSDDDEDVIKWVQENVLLSDKEMEKMEDEETATEFEVRQLV